MADKDVRLVQILNVASNGPEVDIYSFSPSKVKEFYAEISKMDEGYFFFTKLDEKRSNKLGKWIRFGEKPTLVKLAEKNEVVGTKTKFMYFEINPKETPDGRFFLTEYRRDELYRVRHNLPKDPVEYVTCVPEYEPIERTTDASGSNSSAKKGSKNKGKEKVLE